MSRSQLTPNVALTLAVVAAAGWLVVLIAGRTPPAAVPAGPRPAAWPTTAEVMNRRIDRLDFHGVPLAEALETVGRKGGVAVLARWPALADVRIDRDTRVDACVHDVTLAGGLRAVLASLDGTLAFGVSDEVVSVSVRRDPRPIPSVVGVYDIRGLISRPSGLLRALSWLGSRPIPSDTGDGAFTLIGVFDWLLDCAENERPGRGQQPTPPDPSARDVNHWNGRLIVKDTPENQAELAAALGGLRGLDGWSETTQAPDPDVTGAAESRVGAIRFDQVPLEQVVEALRGLTHANIVVNWRAMESAGVTWATPVTLSIGDASLPEALSAVLADADPADPDGFIDPRAPRLAFREDKEIVTISTDKDLRGVYCWRIYDVRDIIAPRLVKARGRAGVAKGVDPERDAEDILVREIEDAVGQNSWRARESYPPRIFPHDGRLIIQQTLENQRRIARFLRHLRESGTAE